MSSPADLPVAFPNVRATLRRHRRLPGTPDITTMIKIWASGTRYRVVDLDGRRASELIMDVTHPQGFGLAPRTIGDFMDAASAATLPRRQPTEVYGDLSTAVAYVHEDGQPRWATSADDFVIVVAQLFLPVQSQFWRPIGSEERLGRRAEIFESETSGDEDGAPYRTTFTWAVSHPYVMARHVRHSQNAGMSVEVDVVELEEGLVGDLDLTRTQPAPSA